MKKNKKKQRNALFRSEMYQEYYEMYSYSASAEIAQQKVRIDKKLAMAQLAASEAEAEMLQAIALQKKSAAKKIIAENSANEAVGNPPA